MSFDISIAEKLCVSCSLCCDGTIFADVRLQPTEDDATLRKLGLPLSRSGKHIRCQQPCAALREGRCQVYAERPNYCREFECALFKGVMAQRIELAPALRLIRSTRQRAAKVKELLRALGDEQETLSLSKRFRRLQRRIESGDCTPEQADLFGELTMAVHELNFVLSEKFYPGATE